MNYIESLQQYKLKVTPQRLEILDIIYQYGHINIDDLYNLLQKKFPTISLATIYKNINTMCDNLLLSEVKIPNKKNLYELTKTEHIHLICTKCDNVSDIELDISDLQSKIELKSDYKVIDNSIVFSGICPQCLKENNE